MAFRSMDLAGNVLQARDSDRLHGCTAHLPFAKGIPDHYHHESTTNMLHKSRAQILWTRSPQTLDSPLNLF